MKYNFRIAAKAAAFITTASVLVCGFAAMPVTAEEANAEEAAVTAVETVEAADDAAAEAEKKAAEETAEAAAKTFTLTNQTGAELKELSVIKYNPAYYPNADIILLQETLIEKGFLDDVADGSYGPKTEAAVAAFREENKLGEGEADEDMLAALYGEYWNGNLLGEGILPANATQSFTYHTPQPDYDKAGREDAADDLASILETYGMAPEYLLTFKTADDIEYTVHVFSYETMKNVFLKLEGDVAYLEYEGEDGSVVSTLEAEQAVYDAEHPAPAAATYDDYYSYDDTWYAEDGYYDYAYEEPTHAGDGCLTDGTPMFNP